MATREDIHSLLAKKQAGVCRMRDRQKRVHLKMAQMIEEHPEMIDKAVKKVSLRLENSGVTTREIYAEWHEILTTWSVDRILAMLRDDSADTEQLRACAPFDFMNV